MEEAIDINNTRVKILIIFRNYRPSTKQSIAQKLGINITTASKLVNVLNIPGDYIKLAGFEDSTEGKKPKLYTINNNAGYIIGIDVGGGTSKSGNIMLKAIKRIVQMRALEVVSKKVQIITSELDGYSSVWGTAIKFINLLFTDYKYNILSRNII